MRGVELSRIHVRGKEEGLVSICMQAVCLRCALTEPHVLPPAPPATAGTTWRVASPVYSPRSSTRVSAVGGGRGGGGGNRGRGSNGRERNYTEGSGRRWEGPGARRDERSGGEGGEVSHPPPAFDLTARPPSPPLTAGADALLSVPGVSFTAPPRRLPLTAGADALLSMPGVSLYAPVRTVAGKGPDYLYHGAKRAPGQPWSQV